MIIQFSQRQDRYKKKYIGKIVGGNIRTDENNRLPECPDKYVAFTWLYSPTYTDESEGFVNTHFDYPYSRKYKAQNNEGCNRVYAKLSWWKRQQLAYITRKSWFHTHPVATWALILNFLFALANLYFAFQNHQNSIRNVQSNYLETITKQIELQKQQSDQHNRQIELLLNNRIVNRMDSTTLK